MEIVCVQIPFLKSSFKAISGLCSAKKKTAADLVVVAFISSSYRLTLFIFMGEKFCPFGVPSSGNYWKPFVGIFFSLSKEKKSAHETRKKKSQWFKKNS